MAKSSPIREVRWWRTATPQQTTEWCPYFTPPYFAPPWFYPTLFYPTLYHPTLFYPTLILPHPWLYPTFYFTPPSTLPHLLQYPTLFYPTFCNTPTYLYLTFIPSWALSIMVLIVSIQYTPGPGCSFGLLSFHFKYASTGTTGASNYQLFIGWECEFKQSMKYLKMHIL